LFSHWRERYYRHYDRPEFIPVGYQVHLARAYADRIVGPAKLLPDDDLLSRIDAMDLKHVLGDIQTDCGNLHVDGSLMWFVATITLRRFVAGSGRRPPHQKRL
jgi:hypothetical protein